MPIKTRLKNHSFKFQAKKMWLPLPLPFMAIMVLSSFAVLSLFSSCQTRNEEKKTIRIGLTWDLTGPVSEGGGLALNSYQDYIGLFEEKGGIKGARIELLWADSGYNISRVLSNYTRFKEQGAVIIQAQASLEAYTLKPLAERDQIPILTTGVDAGNYFPPGWIFTSGGGSTAEYYAVFLKWLKGSWKEPRAPRIAVIGWDNTLGRAPQAARKYTAEIGAQIVAEEFLPVTAVDYSGQLLRIKNANPDYVFVGIASGGFGPFLKDAERVGIRGKIPIVTNGVAPIDQAIGPAGALSEGLIAFNTRAVLSETNNPGIKEMQDYITKVRGKPLEVEQGTWAWIEMKAMLELVRRAADEEGLDKLTGTAVKKAIERTRNLDMNGLTRPLSYSPEKRRGNDYARMVQLKGGKNVVLTDWIEIPVVRVD